MCHIRFKTRLTIYDITHEAKRVIKLTYYFIGLIKTYTTRRKNVNSLNIITLQDKKNPPILRTTLAHKF